jgi:hypothetical protein
MVLTTLVRGEMQSYQSACNIIWSLTHLPSMTPQAMQATLSPSSTSIPPPPDQEHFPTTQTLISVLFHRNAPRHAFQIHRLLVSELQVPGSPISHRTRPSPLLEATHRLRAMVRRPPQGAPAQEAFADQGPWRSMESTRCDRLVTQRTGPGQEAGRGGRFLPKEPAAASAIRRRAFPKKTCHCERGRGLRRLLIHPSGPSCYTCLSIARS